LDVVFNQCRTDIEFIRYKQSEEVACFSGSFRRVSIQFPNGAMAFRAAIAEVVSGSRAVRYTFDTNDLRIYKRQRLT
jgi:hypothetical protein